MSARPGACDAAAIHFHPGFYEFWERNTYLLTFRGVYSVPDAEVNSWILNVSD
jgi:hypothetical protein